MISALLTSILLFLLTDGRPAGFKRSRSLEEILSDPEFMEWLNSKFPNIAFFLSGRNQEPSTETVREIFRFMAELNNYYAIYGRARFG
nr:neuropeptide [Hymenolepis microstoma]